MAHYTMNYLLRIFALISISLFLIQCANQLPPPGGPIDNEPPEVLEVYPQNGTLNFSDDYFEFTFSEYIDKFSIMDALFISPEINRLEYDWSGTSVEVTFDDTLNENTTYTVSIGSNIQDLNNRNSLAKAVNFAFSTGSQLDVGEISGKVYDKDPNGVMIFAYMKKDSFDNPILVKPKNVSQVGENGEFWFLGLANGKYRIFAVKEENKNRIYNVGEDFYGAPFKEITLTDSSSKFEGLTFRLAKEDTLPPYMTNITMTDRNHILIEYSENIDSSKVSKDNFFIVDSINQKITNTKYFFQSNQNKPEYFITITDSLDQDGNYFVVARNIFDRSGNELETDSYQFVISSAPDTLSPSFKRIETGYDQNKLDYDNPTFKIFFSDGISSENLSEAISIKYKNKNNSFDLIKVDDAQYQINILNKLKPSRNLEFNINNEKIWDAVGNQLDSVNTINIETLSGREFSGVSGQISIQDTNKSIVVVLEGIDNRSQNYFTSMNSDKSFSLERILPGNYLIWCFIDSDKTGEFNFGSIEPFGFAEKFYTYPDTLKLRARWPVRDVLITD